MKSTIAVVSVFVLGCLAGWSGVIDPESFGTALNDVTMAILFVLVFLVGISMGANPELKAIIKAVRPRIFLVPVASVAGTLVFTAAASLFLEQWSLSDCLAVGSGFGYYSLSSVLIAQYKEISLGAQLAAELGTIALLTNIFRELFTLTASRMLKNLFGPFAPVASAGATAADVCLPVIMRTSGNGILPVAIVSGMVTDFSVPFLVSFFCSF